MSRTDRHVIPINRLAPADLGPLIDAAAIVAKIGGRKPPTEKWVRLTVPGKIQLSYNVVRWYERQVDAWIAERAERSLAS